MQFFSTIPDISKFAIKMTSLINLFLGSDSFYNYIRHTCSERSKTNYCNINLLILDEKQSNKIMKPYYFYTLKGLWDDQGGIKMYYGISRIKKQLSGKRSIEGFL